MVIPLIHVGYCAPMVASLKWRLAYIDLALSSVASFYISISSCFYIMQMQMTQQTVFKPRQTSSRTYNQKGFGYKVPPLSVTIREILLRYPDGQIFKV